MSAGHGGQVLLSLATQELVHEELPDGVQLRDMGEWQLKDAIRPVRQHDYEAFYRAELAQRAAVAYPPLGRLVHVLVSGPEEAETLAVAERLAEQARDAVGATGEAPSLGFEVLGPGPSPIARLRDRFRFQLLLKGNDEKRVLDAGRALAAIAHGRETAGVRIQVDANPVNML
jgi:primosomal protein N' (replication factor Y)